MDLMFLLKLDWGARIDILRLHDVMLAPIYLGLLIILGLLLRRRYCKDRPELEPYFMPALILRFIGCFCFTYSMARLCFLILFPFH